MSYTTINQSAQDPALSGRVTAATVQEAWNNLAVTDGDYAGHVKASAANATHLVWPVCTAADVAAAYESALAADNPDPGGDPAVITDGMILANVQAKWPADPWPAP